MTGQRPDRKPTREGVIHAAEKVAQVVPATPLLPRETPAGTLWCKAESLQPVGAFKLRGAWHRLSDLSQAERAAGVVAFSSGNHAQGVAWAARRLEMAATIVMPADAPRKKIESTRALGAEIVLYDRATESREAIAGALAKERGATLVPSFDDPWVIEGQGSAGIEAEAQMRALAGGAPGRIVIPCGGGGLSAGIALACPEAEIFVAEPEGWDDMARSLAAGEIVPVNGTQGMKLPHGDFARKGELADEFGEHPVRACGALLDRRHLVGTDAGIDLQRPPFEFGFAGPSAPAK